MLLSWFYCVAGAAAWRAHANSYRDRNSPGYADSDYPDHRAIAHAQSAFRDARAKHHTLRHADAGSIGYALPAADVHRSPDRNANYTHPDADPAIQHTDCSNCGAAIQYPQPANGNRYGDRSRADNYRNTPTNSLICLNSLLS